MNRPVLIGRMCVGWTRAVPELPPRATTRLIVAGLMAWACAPPPAQVITTAVQSDACTVSGFVTRHPDAGTLGLVPAESLEGGRLAWSRDTGSGAPPPAVLSGLSGDVLVAVVVDSSGARRFMDPVKVVISRYQGGVSPYDSATQTPIFTAAALGWIRALSWDPPVRHGVRVNAFHCLTVFYHATGNLGATTGFRP